LGLDLLGKVSHVPPQRIRSTVNKEQEFEITFLEIKFFQIIIFQISILNVANCSVKQAVWLNMKVTLRTGIKATSYFAQKEKERKRSGGWRMRIHKTQIKDSILTLSHFFGKSF
jgi:hypothetical protein